MVDPAAASDFKAFQASPGLGSADLCIIGSHPNTKDYCVTQHNCISEISNVSLFTIEGSQFRPLVCHELTPPGTEAGGQSKLMTAMRTWPITDQRNKASGMRRVIKDKLYEINPLRNKFDDDEICMRCSKEKIVIP